MFKLLLVEDEYLILKWLSYVIDYEKLGLFVVGQAENGEQGAELIRELHPDIVLSDINMPKMNAFEMFEATEDIKYKKIILSGYDDFPNARKALQFGVRDFLSKPLNVDELKNTLMDVVVALEKEQHPDAMMKVLTDFYTKEDGEAPQNSAITQILLWIQDNFDQKFTVSELARALGYSESNIYKIVKEHMGMTINDYTTNYRIKVAISLMLEKPKMHIYEISEQVGFSDYKYFNKIFKRRTGLTVSDFKSKLSNRELPLFE